MRPLLGFEGISTLPCILLTSVQVMMSLLENKHK